MYRETSVRTLLAKHAHPSAIPQHDLQLLLAHTLHRSRTWVLAHPEAVLTGEQAAAFDAALARLLAGEPLPYILGHWEFYGLDFLITPDVLIPRPETELIVETALRAAGVMQQPKILDVATGSGCLAVTLAVHLPEAGIVATDISASALAVAGANAQKHGVAARVQFIQADLVPLQPCSLPAFNLLVANLPYIPTPTLLGLDVYGKEPTLALDGGLDGLDLIRRLLADASAFLALGGMALLEIEATQGDVAVALARRHFPTAQVRVLPDLAGLDRLLVIQT
ncbi:MAG: peptide chain release factor N(5)-glutamine methyltransferase [Chloroflexota bacterium]